MESKLDIQKTTSGKRTELKLRGRLDANWSGHLDDTIQSLIRDGLYELVLDMRDVVYMSSAGIRILVKQFKNLNQIGGSLTLSGMSEPVAQVIEMVGMTELMQGTAVPEETPTEPSSDETILAGYRFSTMSRGTAKMILSVHGEPDRKGYTLKDNRLLKVDGDVFALGLGAMGSGFEDCSSRYGEFLAFGESVAYMPTDQSPVPDYTLSTGQYVAEINALFAIIAKGEFAGCIVFEPAEPAPSIPFHALLESLFELTGYRKMVILLAAESDGLIGMRIRKSPVNDPSVLELPGLRDNLFFTTEPAYPRMLTLSFGYFENEPGIETHTFVRPIKTGSPISGHLHAAVFPYQPMKKTNPDYREIIRSLFSSSEVQDILHLLNDTREINGLGDSRFKNGTCWIGPIA